jgi:hypothetical protein
MVAETGSGEAAGTAGDDGRDWEAVRLDYETSPLTLKDIAARHGMHPSTLRVNARRRGWKPRYRTAPKRGPIIQRMLRIVDMHVSQLEQTMTAPTDKEAALLASLARTLDKLIELDNAEKGRTANDRKAGDLASLRGQLARRIEGLKHG